MVTDRVFAPCHLHVEGTDDEHVIRHLPDPWLMPDNRRTGALEDFLADLVKDGDPIYVHAAQATATAKQLGARFSTGDAVKANLHAWLAWQKEPGRPYGVAIKARYLRDDSEAARRFVAWYGRLSGVAAGL